MRISLNAAVVVLLVGLAACETAAPPSRSIEERIGRIQAEILPAFVSDGEAVARPSLLERMRQLGVPGVSVAVSRQLAEELVAAVAREYGWDLAPR